MTASLVRTSTHRAWIPPSLASAQVAAVVGPQERGAGSVANRKSREGPGECEPPSASHANAVSS